MEPRLSLRKISDSRGLALYRERTARFLDVRYPTEYLERSLVVAIVSESITGEIEEVLGGYIIASKGPFRSLEQIPAGIVANNTLLRSRMDRCQEITGLWIHPRLRNGSIRFKLWWNLFMDSLKECFRGKPFVVYSYDASKKKLGDMYKISKPSVIYEGPVFTRGMKEEKDEVIEIGSPLSVAVAFFRHPLLIANFICQRVFRHTPSPEHDQHTTTPEDEKEIVKDVIRSLGPFLKVSPWRFRIDLVLTAVIAWGSLFFLTYVPVSPAVWMLGFVLCYCSFYRGHAFIHETIHFQARVRGLRTLYNLLFGFPNRVPAFTHDPHRFHHLPSTFATKSDPEYDHFGGRGWKAVVHPFTVGILLPWVLIARFGILPLVMWCFGKKSRDWIYRRLSTVVVNPKYERSFSLEEMKVVKIEESVCALFFVAGVVAIALGVIPIQGFVIWLLMVSTTAFVNVWRARVAHLYDNSEKTRLSPLSQLRDSVTVESRALTFLWAPANMQYHSLHHLAPQIPYHNLRSAHLFLLKSLPARHPYRQSVSPSFGHAAQRFIALTLDSKA